MGNTQSTTGSIPLSNILNYVSANYILTSKFQDMQKLTQESYCDNLVVLTSKIISNHLTNQEVEYLSQRLQGNKEVNYMKKEGIAYLPKEQMMQLDVRNKTQKKRICIGIAKFYVKIAHIYGAIITTLRPLNQPDGSRITKQNVCDQRINALEQNKTTMTAAGVVNVFPSFCSKTATLLDQEPGIRELEKLYYDDYSFSKGEFIGMTQASRKEYEKDVKFFYKAFIGKRCPPHIKTFGQIPLTDYKKHRLCNTNAQNNGDDGANEDDETITPSQAKKLKQRLFTKYAKHIQTMMKSAEEKRNKLVSIIDKLFVFGVHPQTQKKEIMINPKLTMKSVDTLSIETREYIKELYAECEKNFAKGIDIFEAIVHTQFLQTSQNKMRVLERKRNKLMNYQNDEITEKREPLRTLSEYRGGPGSPLPYPNEDKNVRFYDSILKQPKYET